MDRRRFLATAAGLAAAAAGASWAAAIEPWNIEVTRTTVRIRNLPEPFDGFRLALLADIHHGRSVGAGYISRAVSGVNALGPDAVVLAGDYVLGDDRFFEPCMAILSRLRCPVYSVLGNHDHWEGAGIAAGLLAGMVGAVDLRNRHETLSRGGATLRMAGVGDLWEDSQDLDACLDGLRGEPVILACHNPDYAEQIPEGAVDLVLSGHTHGGQIVIPGLGAPVLPSGFGQKYRAGLVQGPVQVYVTRGVGVGNPPVRFNCRPEIAIVTLRPPEGGAG